MPCARNIRASYATRPSWRTPDYLEHMRAAAANARNFVDGMKKL
jgi:hypothetical protein